MPCRSRPDLVGKNFVSLRGLSADIIDSSPRAFGTRPFDRRFVRRINRRGTLLILALGFAFRPITVLWFTLGVPVGSLHVASPSNTTDGGRTAAAGSDPSPSYPRRSKHPSRRIHRRLCRPRLYRPSIRSGPGRLAFHRRCRTACRDGRPRWTPRLRSAPSTRVGGMADDRRALRETRDRVGERWPW
jgi:hypothetical protein